MTLSNDREVCASPYASMDREELLRALEMFAKSWLAHDGSWFLAAEERLGMEAAVELDAAAWKLYAVAEAKRIMSTFGIPLSGGLSALEKALRLRQYSFINSQHVEWLDEGARLRFVMNVCRVQEARRRKGLPDFPCKSVGIIEFETFARTIDPRIETRCLHCPPDVTSGKHCAWEFRISDDATAECARKDSQ